MAAARAGRAHSSGRSSTSTSTTATARRRSSGRTARCSSPRSPRPLLPGDGRQGRDGRRPRQGGHAQRAAARQHAARALQDALDRVLEATLRFGPQLLLVSAGFDAYRDDPVGGLGLAPEHYAWIGERLRATADDACEGRVVAALEGGYALDALGDLARAFVGGLGG
ncbi:MAG: hypothetical protein KIT58_02695 [Planctomycetota bacterium]|nr:hypothetical protein [Planctomycetota bacterium]